MSDPYATLRLPTKGKTMTVLHIPASLFDGIDDDERMVCVFCDQDTTLPYCALCNEYKGLMTIAEWESYTGEVWE